MQHAGLQNLRRWRLAQKMSQAALAEKAGFTQAAISQFERQVRLPTLRTIARLSEKLGISEMKFLAPQRNESISREQADRIARAIVWGDTGGLSLEERRRVGAIGSLIIQKLRAEAVPGRTRYVRSRCFVKRRWAWAQQIYGRELVVQVLKRVDTLLAMGIQS